MRYASKYNPDFTCASWNCSQSRPNSHPKTKTICETFRKGQLLIWDVTVCRLLRGLVLPPNLLSLLVYSYHSSHSMTCNIGRYLTYSSPLLPSHTGRQRRQGRHQALTPPYISSRQLDHLRCPHHRHRLLQPVYPSRDRHGRRRCGTDHDLGPAYPLCQLVRVPGPRRAGCRRRIPGQCRRSAKCSFERAGSAGYIVRAILPGSSHRYQYIFKE